MSHDDFNPNSMDAAIVRIDTMIDIILAEQKKDKSDIEELKKWRWFAGGIGAALVFAVDKMFGK